MNNNIIAYIAALFAAAAEYTAYAMNAVHERRAIDEAGIKVVLDTKVQKEVGGYWFMFAKLHPELHARATQRYGEVLLRRRDGRVRTDACAKSALERTRSESLTPWSVSGGLR